MTQHLVYTEPPAVPVGAALRLYSCPICPYAEVRHVHLRALVTRAAPPSVLDAAFAHSIMSSPFLFVANSSDPGPEERPVRRDQHPPQGSAWLVHDPDQSVPPGPRSRSRRKADPWISYYLRWAPPPKRFVITRAKDWWPYAFAWSHDKVAWSHDKVVGSHHKLLFRER